MSSARRRCGSGMCSAQGSRSPSWRSAVWMVKSAGVMSSRSSQATGNETGTPGRTRGLYAAITVAPPTRVESTKTLPPRSALTNAVVAISGIELLGPCRDGAGRGGRVLERCLVVDRDEHVQSLGAAGLHRAGQADIGQGLANRVGGPNRHREGIGFGRVEVEHQVRDVVRPVGAHQGGVILDRALVGEPQQRPPVVAQRVRHVPLRRLRPPLHGADPVRRVLRHVLLHERFLAAMDADHRQRPVLRAPGGSGR